MKPALTKDEWANYKHVKRVDGEFDLFMEAHPPNYVDVGDDDVYIRVSDENLHALAALCLHGQPFGFTREDVRWLRDHAGCNCGENECPDPPSGLAMRIAALLPPEDV